MRKLLIVLALLVSSKTIAGPIIQVEAQLYKIETVTGVLSSFRNLIEDQMWYGNSDLANQFSNTLGAQITSPFNWGLGPAFGYEIYDGVGADYTTAWFYKQSNYHLAENNRAQVQNATAGSYYTYAIASHVGTVNISEPNSLALFFILPFIFALKKYKNRT